MVGNDYENIYTQSVRLLGDIGDQIHFIRHGGDTGQEEVMLVKHIKYLLDLYGYSPDDVNTISQMQWGN